MSFKLSKFLFFFLFIFTPLAFGTTEAWSYAVMEILTCFALLFFFIHTIRHQDEMYQVPGLLPLVLFLTYILVQTIPLPGFIVHLLSPHAYEIHQANQQITGTHYWIPLTLHPKVTLNEFFRYSTYVLFYILTVQLLSKNKNLQICVFIITLFGALLAFSSIIQFYTTEDMALWFRHSPRNSIVMGPYVNHNHYAGLMEMIFPIALGLFLFYRPRINNTSLIKGVAEIFKQEKANIHILIGSAVLLIIVSIFVSLSRGAMLSSFMALIFFTFLLLKRKISKGNTMVLIGVIMITALCIGWFGWDQIFERFAQLKKAHGVIYESRVNFWKDTKEIIRDYPITGSGMGSFASVYPSYRTFESDSTTILTHAHNDYLELLAEGGVIGFGLAACFLITLFFKTYKVFLKRRDALSIYLYIGCITGMLSILFHSFTDFNTHIGANGLWFFFTAGIAVCAANTSLRKKYIKTRLQPVVSEKNKLFAGAIVAGLTFFALMFNMSNLAGIFYFSNIDHYIITPDSDPELVKDVKKITDYSAGLDPFNSEYPFMQANTAWILGEPGLAKDYYISSLKLEPTNSRHLKRFARFTARQGEMNAAEIAFNKSMVYARNNAEYTFEYAVWNLSQNKFEQGVNHMKRALELDAGFMERALTAMIIYKMKPEQIEAAIPDDPSASIAFAKFLYQTGREDEAVKRYENTLDMIEKQVFPKSKTKRFINTKKREQLFRLYWFFRKNNYPMNAMEVMIKAETILPKDADVQVALGDLYHQQGVLYKAIERYDHALLLDPENERAKQMKKKLSQ